MRVCFKLCKWALVIVKRPLGMLNIMISKFKIVLSCSFLTQFEEVYAL